MKKASLFVITAMILFVTACKLGNSNSDSQTYIEKIRTVQEIELSQPTKFLNVLGDYKSNFWGNKLNVHGKIISNATVATYKDAVVRVTYLSKTNTQLGNKEYTIYEILLPHSETSFEIKIQNYKDVNTIELNIVRAIPN